MKEIKTVAEGIGEKIVGAIKDNMSEYGQGDSNLAKNLRYEANEESITIYAPDYFEYAEKGRGPGGLPRNIYSILSSWVDRHKIHFDGDKNRFVRAVAWNIYHHGTRMWRNGEVRDFLKGVEEKAEKWIEEDITKSLIEDITETVKTK